MRFNGLLWCPPSTCPHLPPERKQNVSLFWEDRYVYHLRRFSDGGIKVDREMAKSGRIARHKNGAHLPLTLERKQNVSLFLFASLSAGSLAICIINISFFWRTVCAIRTK